MLPSAYLAQPVWRCLSHKRLHSEAQATSSRFAAHCVSLFQLPAPISMWSVKQCFEVLRHSYRQLHTTDWGRRGASKPGWHAGSGSKGREQAGGHPAGGEGCGQHSSCRAAGPALCPPADLEHAAGSAAAAGPPHPGSRHLAQVQVLPFRSPLSLQYTFSVTERCLWQFGKAT